MTKAYPFTKIKLSSDFSSHEESLILLWKKVVEKKAEMHEMFDFNHITVSFGKESEEQ